MDYKKLKEYGQSIKMTDEMKDKVIDGCKAVQNEKHEKTKGILLSTAVKRAAAVLAVFAVIGIGFLCKQFLKQPTPPVANTNVSETVSNFFENLTTYSQTESFTKSGSIEMTENTDQGGGELLPRKYRNNYYQIPSFFAEIVGRNVCSDWQDEYFADKYPDNTNEMVMVAYVKEFNISKEDFERANLEYAKFIQRYIDNPCLNPQDYADQEIAEIFNTDIIYTFDDAIINEYYLGIDYPFTNKYQYDEALESGTYETRTTEFIDIEQMEAEINAKYGAPEVTETATAIPEETE